MTAQRKTPMSASGFSKTSDTLAGVLRGEIMVMPPPPILGVPDVESMLEVARRRYAVNASWLIPGDKIIVVREEAKAALGKAFEEFAKHKGRIVVLIATERTVIKAFEDAAQKAKLEFKAFPHHKPATDFCRDFRKKNPIPA